MNSNEAMQHGREIAKAAKVKEKEENFLAYSQEVAAAAKSLTQAQRDQLPWFNPWVREWKKLYDEYDRRVEADPMILYRPAHDVSLDFHKSPAFIRYFRAGNRTSKTMSGYAEHYFVATGQHKWRKFPDPRTNKIATFIIGLAYTKYGHRVFEAKMLRGEPEARNPLTPMFPIGGKWFNHYSEKTKVLKIACPNCAEAGKAQSCKHKKAEITLFSDEGGVDVLQGAQYNLGHFDEHIPEEFFSEARIRLINVKNSSFIVTGTPLHGPEAWEQRVLAKLYENGPPENLDSRGRPIVSMHQISMYDAGLVNKEDIDEEVKLLDYFEIQARIYGKPAALAKNPVFDRQVLAEMLEEAKPPDRGHLRITGDIVLEEELERRYLEFDPHDAGPLRIWETPAVGADYIIGVDTARGLTDGDASAASVLKVTHYGTNVTLDLVAQYHGWVNPLDYAEELFKLAVFYNSALVSIELTGGFGEATMLKLRQDYAYWNIFRDESNHAQAKHRLAGKLGVETNVRTKPFMISSLQRFVKDRAITIPCSATIREMTAYEQERSDKGTHTRFGGATGAHDDRVMSLVIGCATAVAAPHAFIPYENERPKISEAYNEEWVDIHREMRTTDDDLFDA